MLAKKWPSGEGNSWPFETAVKENKSRLALKLIEQLTKFTPSSPILKSLIYGECITKEKDEIDMKACAYFANIYKAEQEIQMRKNKRLKIG